MKVFILAILMCYGPNGLDCTPMVESPRIEYKTMEECLSAAKIKRSNMLKSAKKYPDLGIVDIRIECEASIHTDDWQPGDLNIPI